MTTPRVVLVHRRSEYDELIARHGTRGQATFFLQTREQSIEAVDQRHRRTEQALDDAAAHIPLDWRRAQVERHDLAQFVFGPEDIIVVVGQDGLVANLSKYLHGQPVIGVDPEPGVNAGVLVTHAPNDLSGLLPSVASGRAQILERTMVAAESDDGQTMVALNEIFVGQPSHQSARYRIDVPSHHERQSSSGIIIGSGTGATGWCRSIQQLQAPSMRLPKPTEPTVAWFVREPWPSPSTGASLTGGLLTREQSLDVTVESDSLVAFGDGMESDRIVLGWGQRLRVHRADLTLRTVVAAVASADS